MRQITEKGGFDGGQPRDAKRNSDYRRVTRKNGVKVCHKPWVEKKKKKRWEVSDLRRVREEEKALGTAAIGGGKKKRKKRKKGGVKEATRVLPTCSARRTRKQQTTGEEERRTRRRNRKRDTRVPKKKIEKIGPLERYKLPSEKVRRGNEKEEAESLVKIVLIGLQKGEKKGLKKTKNSRSRMKGLVKPWPENNRSKLRVSFQQTPRQKRKKTGALPKRRKRGVRRNPSTTQPKEQSFGEKKTKDFRERCEEPKRATEKGMGETVSQTETNLKWPPGGGVERTPCTVSKGCGKKARAKSKERREKERESVQRWTTQIKNA